MRLQRLKLEHFAAVASCQVEFGPGLNVLYGPNELGKSTLAQAIRAALLLQCTSAMHEPWVRWNSAELPTVELVFQTEPQRFWKVKKSFGSTATGKATLDESKDDVSYSNLAKARAVDGEIRKLLKWGVRQPGGRGLPETYLTTVLLPEQDNVTAIFDRDLSQDEDESGKQTLRDALQAMAADPLFVQVLKAAQAKVDEAFTTTGRQRSGKSSPWRTIKEEIKRAQQRVDQSRDEQQQSEAVRQQIQRLHDQLFELKEECEQAELARAQQEQRLAQRLTLATQLNEAKQELDRVRKIVGEYRELQSKEQQLALRCQQLEEACKSSDAAVSQCEDDIKLAEEAMEAAASETTAAQRQIRMQEDQNEILKLEKIEQQLRQKLERAEKIGGLHQEVATLTTAITQETDELSSAQDRLQAIDKRQQVLANLRLWQQKQDALQRLELAQQATRDVAQWTKENEQYQLELDELARAIEGVQIPDESAFNELTRLAEELRIARGQLEVGLAITVTPHRNLDVATAADDDPPGRLQATSDPLTIDANRFVEVRIDGVADITVHAGRPDVRQTVDALTKRWASEMQPALVAAKAGTWTELLAAKDRIATAEARSAELRKQLEWNSSKIQEKRAAAEESTVVQGEIDTLDRQLAGFDEDAHAANIAEVRSYSMEARAEFLREQQDQQDREREQLSVQVARNETRLTGLQTDCAGKQRDLAEAEESLGESWQPVLEGAKDSLAELVRRLTSLRKQLAAFQQQDETELDVAQEQLASAKQKRDQAVAGRSQQRSEREKVHAEWNQCRGELAVRQPQVQGADIAVAEAAVETVDQRLSDLDKLGMVTQESLDAETRRVSEMKAAMQDLQRNIDNAQGQLQVVGGDIARERHDSFTEALEQKHIEESEMSLDYDAWRLLATTLHEVENSEAAHLGRAIVDPISKRIDQLTGSRYGKMELGPALETQGIVADGDVRELDRLSVGTREQFSTIVRLTLAEHLQSVLILDDQLTQSDPQRIEWFRDLFRQSAGKTQIIVMTCRPADYLLPDELASGQPYAVSEDERIRAANLELLVDND